MILLLIYLSYPIKEISKKAKIKRNNKIVNLINFNKFKKLSKTKFYHPSQIFSKYLHHNSSFTINIRIYPKLWSILI